MAESHGGIQDFRPSPSIIILSASEIKVLSILCVLGRQNFVPTAPDFEYSKKGGHTMDICKLVLSNPANILIKNDF